MIVARKRQRPTLLKIAGKPDYEIQAGILYRLRPTPRPRSPHREPGTIPFEKWNMPPQEEGYIKCRKFDFL